MNKILIGVIIGLVVFSSIALAVPEYVTVQGRLTDLQDDPYVGSTEFEFWLFDSIVGGNDVWHETQTLVLENGVFHALLGTVQSLDLPFDQDYFLEVRVGGEILSPRVRVTSSGYAYTAEGADDFEVRGDISTISSDTWINMPSNGFLYVEGLGEGRGVKIHDSDIESYGTFEGGAAPLFLNWNTLAPVVVGGDLVGGKTGPFNIRSSYSVDIIPGNSRFRIFAETEDEKIMVEPNQMKIYGVDAGGLGTAIDFIYGIKSFGYDVCTAENGLCASESGLACASCDDGDMSVSDDLTVTGGDIFGANNAQLDIGEYVDSDFTFFDNSDADEYVEFNCRDSDSYSICQFNTGLYVSGGNFYANNNIYLRGPIVNDHTDACDGDICLNENTKVNGGLTVTGDLSVDGVLTDDLVVGGDLSIGTSSDSDNDMLAFDAGNEGLSWVNSMDRFQLSNDLDIDGHFSINNANIVSQYAYIRGLCRSDGTWQDISGPSTSYYCGNANVWALCTEGYALSGGCACYNGYIVENHPNGGGTNWGGYPTGDGWECRCSQNSDKDIWVQCVK